MMKRTRVIHCNINFAGDDDSTVRQSFTLPIPPNSSVFNSIPPSDAIARSSDLAITTPEPVDRSSWRSQALSQKPAIRDLVERLRPFERACKFASLHDVGTQLVKEALTPERLIELILQHLTASGLRATRKVLQEEAHIDYVHRELDGSRLATLLLRAVVNAERVFDLSMAVPPPPPATTTTSASSADTAEAAAAAPAVTSVTAGSTVSDTEGQLVELLMALGLESADDLDTEPDVNIWEADAREGIVRAPATTSDSLEGIMAASLNKLVELLTLGQTSDTVDNLKFTKTLLMTYRSFTSAERLLSKLIQRFDVPASHADQKLPIQLRVINAIRYWVEFYWFDWTPKLQQQLAEFMKTLPGALLKKLQIVLEKKQAGGQSDQVTVDLKAAPEPKVPKNIWSPALTLLDVDEEEIARQMTLVDYGFYAKLTPSELLNCAWASPKYRHRATNIIALRQRYSDLVLWTAQTCSVSDTPKNRARIMSKFIALAQHLRSIGNFYSFHAVITGLSRTRALTSSWDEVPKREVFAYQALELLSVKVDDYRTALQSQPPPKLPYLEVVLNDLVLIEERDPDDILQGGLINFNKRCRIYDVISNYLQYQQDPYVFMEIHQIKNFVLKYPRLETKTS